MKETSTLSTLVRNLKDLYGLSGVKKSFEDEGCTIDDVMTSKVFTNTWGLDLAIKIGGCGAKSDIVNSRTLDADVLICPMVETEFSIKKFHQTSSNIWDKKMYFVCESKSCYENRNNIFKLASSLGLSGVIVGRSDLVNSFDLGKGSYPILLGGGSGEQKAQVAPFARGAEFTDRATGCRMDEAGGTSRAGLTSLSA